MSNMAEASVVPNTSHITVMNTVEFAVLGYLVAKSHSLDWETKFCRACKERDYARSFLEATAKEAVAKELAQGRVAQLEKVLCKGVGWPELREMLAYTARKRAGRTPKIPTEPEIAVFLDSRFEKIWLELGVTDAEKRDMIGGVIHLLDGDRLTAVDASKIVVAWLEAQTAAAKQVSKAAGAAKLEEPSQYCRRKQADKKQRRLARQARLNADVNLKHQVKSSVSEIGVLGYLVAKEYGLEWESSFPRASKEQGHAKKVLSAMVREVTARMHLRDDVLRLKQAVNRGVGWVELREMLAFSTRRRKRKKYTRGIFPKAEIIRYMKNKFSKPYFVELELNLEARKLTANEAGGIIDSWRTDRALNAKHASKAAARSVRKVRNQWTAKRQKDLHVDLVGMRSERGQYQVKQDRSGTGYLVGG